MGMGFGNGEAGLRNGTLVVAMGEVEEGIGGGEGKMSRVLQMSMSTDCIS